MEQVQVVSKLGELMKKINFSEQNHIVLAGDFNDKRTFNTNTSLNNQLKWEL